MPPWKAVEGPAFHNDRRLPQKDIDTLAAWVDQFQFDNQRYLKDKPLSRIFKIPHIAIDGTLMVNSEGIHPTNLDLSLPHSKIHVSGKIDFNTGYDLYANGSLRLPVAHA